MPSSAWPERSPFATRQAVTPARHLLPCTDLNLEYQWLLTTYSTFGYETVRLAGDSARLFTALNVAASLAAGFGGAALGYALGQVL